MRDWWIWAAIGVTVAAAAFWWMGVTPTEPAPVNRPEVHVAGPSTAPPAEKPKTKVLTFDPEKAEPLPPSFIENNRPARQVVQRVLEEQRKAGEAPPAEVPPPAATPPAATPPSPTPLAPP